MPPKRRTQKAAPKEGNDDEVDEAAELLAELGLPESIDAPEIPWQDSKAKALLRQDIIDGIVPKIPSNSMPTNVIFTSRPEYAEYGYTQFGSRLSNLRKQVKRDLRRANEDRRRLENYLESHPPHSYTEHGYPEWEGSKAQEQLRKDMADNLHEVMLPLELWCLREEYDYYPLKVFRDHIYQETRTKKYYNYLKVKGKKNIRGKKK